jgi:hypothetical protein
VRAYAEETRQATMSFDTVIDGIALGTWIDIQRRLHRTGRLREDRERLLAQLPGWEWDVREENVGTQLPGAGGLRTADRSCLAAQIRKGRWSPDRQLGD